MPCWYYEKRDLKGTPSILNGIDADTEARYRREGARFILDTGSQMGLRYDTCATGVVYFHRFYMFHSFREFHRYVTAACCLFLAGKVEETPKKCKDIINTTRSMLTKQQFQVFGDDPKEELMTLERILLQTIRFDLMVEHPYAYLLKFAKTLKGQDTNDSDKGKIQKMVQMAWTFINDSLCTCLCLLWEADVIAVALMYLASRLNKFDIQEWYVRQTGQRGAKWWDKLVSDVSLELLEDICHQVLDLYSQGQQQRSKEESPPPPPPPKPASTQTGHKRSRASTPSDLRRENQHHGTSSTTRTLDLTQRLADEMGQGPPPPKQSRTEAAHPKSKSPSPVRRRENPEKGDRERERERRESRHHRHKAASQPSSRHSSPAPHGNPHGPPHQPHPQPANNYPPHGTHQGQPPPPGTTDEGYTRYNPYMPSQMYSSSFMSQEGSQSIQSLIGGGGSSNQPPPQTSYGDYQPPSQYNHSGPPPQGHYPPSQQGYQQQSRPGYPPQQPPPPGYQPPQQPQQYPPHTNYPPASQPPYPQPNYSQPGYSSSGAPPQQQPPQMSHAPPQTQTNQQYPPNYPQGQPPNPQAPPPANYPPGTYPPGPPGPGQYSGGNQSNFSQPPPASGSQFNQGYNSGGHNYQNMGPRGPMNPGPPPHMGGPPRPRGPPPQQLTSNPTPGLPVIRITRGH